MKTIKSIVVLPAFMIAGLAFADHHTGAATTGKAETHQCADGAECSCDKASCEHHKDGKKESCGCSHKKEENKKSAAKHG